ncbi:hypothetical protein EDD86DRAFT_248261 [Gorgonomyces haynaldii]|nr:hypothetical protein EDD86DRAFT_248261 [Gorgonomyces haynaldii]
MLLHTLTLVPVSAAPAVVNTTRMTSVPFNSGQPLTIVKFVVDFDQPVYLRNQTGRYALADFQTLGLQDYPELTRMGAGTANLTCNNQRVPAFNYQGQQDGPPNGWLLSPPSLDPTASMLNYIFNGRKLNETTMPNRYALLFPDPQNSRWDNVNCQISFSGAPGLFGFRLVNAQDQPVILSANFNYSRPRCVFEEVDNFKQVIDSVGEISGIAAREALVGCKDLASRFVVTNTTYVSLPAARGCNFPYGTLEWGAEPCCNQTLALTQCCLPKTQTVPQQLITSIDTAQIARFCRTPNKISAILSDFVDADTVTSPPVNPNDLFETYTSFVQTCQDAIWNQACSSDVDCTYSGICNTFSGTCYVDQSNPTPMLMKCFISKMPSDLRLEIKTRLELPPVFSSIDDEVDAITAAVIDYISVVDCTGPRSYQHQSHYEPTKDQNGNFYWKLVPGNRNNCLSEKECSYKDGRRNTADQCTRNGTQTGYCALQIYGDFKMPITQFAQCYGVNMSPQACQQNNGVPSDWDQSTCIFPANSEGECLTGPTCSSLDTSVRRCSSNFCYVSPSSSSGVPQATNAASQSPVASPTGTVRSSTNGAQSTNGQQSSNAPQSTNGAQSTNGQQSTNGAQSTSQAQSTNGQQSSSQAQTTNAAQSTSQAQSTNGQQSSSQGQSTNAAQSTSQAQTTNGQQSSSQAQSTNAAQSTSQAQSTNGQQSSSQAQTTNAAQSTSQAQTTNGQESSSQAQSTNVAQSTSQAQSSDAPQSTNGQQSSSQAQSSDAPTETYEQSSTDAASSTADATTTTELPVFLRRGIYERAPVGQSGSSSSGSPTSGGQQPSGTTTTVRQQPSSSASFGGQQTTGGPGPTPSPGNQGQGGQGCPNGFNYDFNRGICVSYNLNPQQCQASNYQYAYGRNWNPPQFNTQQSCTGNGCSLQRDRSLNGQSCTSAQECTLNCPQCTSNQFSSGACLYNATTVSDCTQMGGNWQNNGCFASASYNATTCPSQTRQWRTCSGLSQNTCTTASYAGILNCQWNIYASCPDRQSCLQQGQCDDWEFGNGQNDGQCYYKPPVPGSPGACGQNQQTRDGGCIVMNRNQNNCNGNGWYWRTRAKTQADCESPKMCNTGQGMSFQNASSCLSCGGVSRNVYRWTTGVWKNGTLAPRQWVPVEWRSVNQWNSTISMDKLREILVAAASKIVARQIVADFNERYAVYGGLFKAIACDCTPGTSNCFSNLISSPIASCNVDPSSVSSCGSKVIFGQGTLNTSLPAMVDLSSVSQSNFVQGGPISKKRAVSASDYAIIKKYGQVVGQLVGSATTITLSQVPNSNVQVCLDVNANIPQDNTTYPNERCLWRTIASERVFEWNSVLWICIAIPGS